MANPKIGLNLVPNPLKYQNVNKTSQSKRKKPLMENNTYKNGQLISEQKDSYLTYFYKNGKVKAIGIFENNLMEGEWIFYRETGQLWQVGNFKNSIKHGHFIRYDRNDKVEYDQNFIDGKIVKKK